MSSPSPSPTCFSSGLSSCVTSVPLVASTHPGTVVGSEVTDLQHVRQAQGPLRRAACGPCSGGLWAQVSSADGIQSFPSILTCRAYPAWSRVTVSVDGTEEQASHSSLSEPGDRAGSGGGGAGLAAAGLLAGSLTPTLLLSLAHLGGSVGPKAWKAGWSSEAQQLHVYPWSEHRRQQLGGVWGREKGPFSPLQ